jgi:hypothetical protein
MLETIFVMVAVTIMLAIIIVAAFEHKAREAASE